MLYQVALYRGCCAIVTMSTFTPYSCNIEDNFNKKEAFNKISNIWSLHGIQLLRELKYGTFGAEDIADCFNEHMLLWSQTSGP